MERKAKVIICSVVGFLGLLSAALGFAAEAKRIKASQIHITPYSTCIYPSSPALGLALSAAVALMIAQIIVSTATGCFCCRRGSYQSNSNSRLGVICFVISWITFINAFRLFLSGAVLNGHHVNEYFDNTSYCFTVRPGVFAGAAVLSLATVVLGIVCYLALDSAKISNNSWGGTAAAPNQGGIAMGHPQFPPPQYPPGPPPQYPPPQYPAGPPPQYPPQNTEAPIFVHEDTYMRRQFT
ncbi:uncharacterized protein LOC131319930 isoform X1 [Rhododendron vialii]|uniref:uncharacterized protein LOC131319930 isoform X1 n=1 Tax=Rhododendron vialii TaxID=182163 RepID=UPI00265EDEE6|nr:uncharacterized protein LOC131319930 isoform X1 [Rhododendron vialii]